MIFNFFNLDREELFAHTFYGYLIYQDKLINSFYQKHILVHVKKGMF